MVDIPLPFSENTLLQKIASFMGDSNYAELMQSAAKFNIRMRRDRRYRQPYIDGQTGVAQRDCHLFVGIKKRQIGGDFHGQILSYPSRRWRAPHRSYLKAFQQPVNVVKETEEHIITTVENPAAAATGVNSGCGASNGLLSGHNVNGNVDIEVPDKETWPTFLEENGYDDMEDDIETDDNDDDETYDRKGRKRKPPAKKKKTKAKKTPAKTPAKSKKKTPAPPVDDDDPEGKPYVCERTKSGRKTSRGASDTSSQVIASERTAAEEEAARRAIVSAEMMSEGKKKVSPSPYCDFCLGDASINKKTNSSERLVSCADCGRSGHPTCLQFTSNMMKSVSSYRWQCIECKTCTLCGTSENDDQLLFCDDCDRGYHLYCLSPALSAPPEGEWSCALCIKNFHSNK